MKHIEYSQGYLFQEELKQERNLDFDFTYNLKTLNIHLEDEEAKEEEVFTPFPPNPPEEEEEDEIDFEYTQSHLSEFMTSLGYTGYQDSVIKDFM